jgi:hypothetical protein
MSHETTYIRLGSETSCLVPFSDDCLAYLLTSAQFREDQCGYGGLIRETRVTEFLKEQGSVLLQGRLGVRAFPYLAVAPTPILPTSIGPNSMYASMATLPPAIHYAHQAHFDLTVPTSLEIENYSRRKCRTTLQEIGWSTNGDLEVLRRRIL